MNPKRSINRDLLALAAPDTDTREISGAKDNPRIVEWLRNAGITWGNVTDEIAWCAAYMYELVGRVPNAPRPTTRRASALGWKDIGEEIPFDEAQPGDIVIFDRGKGRGHIGLFLRRKGRNILVHGGNQGNRVWPKYYGARKLLHVRRLHVEQPVHSNMSSWGGRLRDVQNEGLELFERKNADYGDSFVVHGVIGILMRVQDKLNRLQSVTTRGVCLIDAEYTRDTLLDLHNYAGLGIALMDGEVEENLGSPSSPSSSTPV